MERHVKDRQKNDNGMTPHSSVLPSWSPLTRQSGRGGSDARRTALRSRVGRCATIHSARDSKLAGKIGGLRGADGGVVALTRIFTGQQIVREAGILILQHRDCFCMPPPCFEPGEFDRERKPDSFVAGLLDAMSGIHLTRRLKPTRSKRSLNAAFPGAIESQSTSLWRVA